MPGTLEEAGTRLAALEIEPEEVVADKGYHSNATMKGLKTSGLRGYVSEPDRGRRNWTRDPDAQNPTYANRRRIRGARGKRLLRRRGEILERAFAHLLESGGLRRVHVRGQENIRKRMLVHAAAFNLGLLMRSRFGYGTPRAMQGRAIAQAELAKRAAGAAIWPVIRQITRFLRVFPMETRRSWRLNANKSTNANLRSSFLWHEPLGSEAGFATGC